jgi:hypothetical protein
MGISAPVEAWQEIENVFAANFPTEMWLSFVMSRGELPLMRFNVFELCVHAFLVYEVNKRIERCAASLPLKSFELTLCLLFRLKDEQIFPPFTSFKQAALMK